MDIYNIHPKTGQYLGAGKADPDPKDPDNWLIPAFAVTQAPPAEVAGKLRVFEGKGWTYKDEPKPAEDPVKEVDPKDAIRAQIAQLEATLTPRRILEFIVAGDKTFATQLDAQLAALRSQL